MHFVYNFYNVCRKINSFLNIQKIVIWQSLAIFILYRGMWLISVTVNTFNFADYSNVELLDYNDDYNLEYFEDSNSDLM